MKHVLQSWFVRFVVLGSAMIAGSAQAQDQNTYLYIAHAASGRAMSSTTNPVMPVDISVNGNCFAQGISYGEIRGPYSGPAGTYSFVVSTAQTVAPCTGTVVFSAVASFSAGSAYMGVLGLDGANNLIGLVFALDLSPIPAGLGRYEVVNVTQEPVIASVTNSGGTQSATVEPGTLQEGVLHASIYVSSITDLSNTVIGGPGNVEIADGNLYLYVIAGSAANYEAQLLGPKVIGGVF